MIELKNGETLNGDLVNCDSWMNLTLKNVIQSLANGEEFTKIPEIYVRGIHIKYLRLPEEIMVHAKEQSMLTMEQRNNRNQKRRGQPQGNNFNRRGNFQGRGGYNNNNNNNNRRFNQGQGSQGGNQNLNQNSNQNSGNHNERQDRQAV